VRRRRRSGRAPGGHGPASDLADPLSGLRRLSIASPRWTTAAPACAIGTLAIYWTLERIAAL